MTDKQVDEAVERLKADRIRWLDNHPYESGWKGTCADILTVCTALAELREDRRKRDAEVLRWAARGIAFRGENLKPYPRGAVRNVAKLMLDHANLVERGEIVVNKES